MLTGVPVRRTEIRFDERFGRPDKGATVEFAAHQWHAGAELWVRNGELRARADEPIDVTLDLGNATSLDLTLTIDSGSSASVSTTPQFFGGPMMKKGSGVPVVVSVKQPASTPLSSVTISGQGVGISAVTVHEPFVPRHTTGPLRISQIVLPTSAQDLDHNVVLSATGLTPNLRGYTLRWTDATSPGASEVYAELPPIALTDGQRLRLIPGRATASPTDDALVSAGGPGTTPPPSGAVYSLFGPTGDLLCEVAAMPTPAPAAGKAGLLTAFPNADSTRAFLVPPSSGNAIGPGSWTLRFALTGDAGPDLPVWSIAGVPVLENAELRLCLL
jgi:hypothetical protein